MKRILSLILSLVILLGTFPLGITTTFAAEYNGFTYTVKDNAVTITGSDKSLATITIPSEIEGYPVTTIGKQAFEYYYNLQNVVIPESVTTIGAGAFYGCTGLTDITIPGSVKTIDEMAFHYCTGLKTITFSSGLTSIGEQAFMYNEKLETIIMPKSLTTISDAAFYYCPKITTVYYSGSETDFGNIAIASNNSNLKNANIVYNYQYPITVTAVCGSGEANTEVDVNIELSAESNVCGGSFNVLYDTTKLELVSANAGSVVLDRMPSISPTVGRVRITFVGIYPITNKGTILNIKFKILSGATGTAAITIDSLKMSDFDTNLVTATAVNGQVVILEHTHNWGAWSITKEPTKTTVGEAQRICANDNNHIDTKELPVLTDTTVWTKGAYVAPTCTETGSQTYTSEYGTVIETISATDHSWGAWSITKEPTKTETGTAERICNNDNNHKDSTELAVLTDETVWTKGEYIAPTCDTNGSQSYTSEYGTVIESIHATDHSWGAWNITKEPTKTETGTAERICNNDSNHKDTRELSVLTDETVWTKGEYIAPTCTETGSQTYTSEYGTVIETIPAINHSWGAWSITKEPTKTETGTAERICNNNSNHKDSKEIAILTDDTVWTKGEYIAPTCTETGSQEYISEYGTAIEIIPATDHSWGAWNITTEPTKTTVGEAQRSCTNDSKHIDTKELPILTDTTVWAKGEYIAPTCEVDGSQSYASEYGTVVETIPAINHSWGAWSITKEPTKTETGTAERICNNDNNHKDIKVIATLTDEAVWSKGKYVAPTCEVDGSQTYASEYGTVVETIPAINHSWGAWSITTEPTKTETGIAERICANDENHKDSKEIAILTDEAIWAKGEYVAPTCTETGSQEYISEYGTAIEIIPAINHNWSAWNITTEPTKTTVGEAQRICANDSNHVDTKELPMLTDEVVWTKGEYVAPTCTETGSQTYTSEYGTVVETIPAINHSWGAWSITTEPTKTTVGEAQRVCSNDSNHVDTKELPMLTDTTVWVAGEYIAPTCTETGSQTYTSEYGTVIEIIPATDHSWGAWNITTEPTKATVGEAQRICANDNNHIDTKELPVLTDTTVWTAGAYVAPTCTETGSQTYTSEYGTVVETISAINHNWGAWNITTKPTKTTVGEAQRVCANDNNHIDTIELPVLTDTTVWTKGDSYGPPDCVTDGLQFYISQYGTVTEPIPAPGHDWGAWSITKEPTKTETGTAERICNNSSKDVETKELPVLTDTSVWTVGAYVAPTCEVNGSQTYTSEYGTVIETIPAINHSWGAWSITKEPTKTETGIAERICANDENHKDSKEIAILTDEAIWAKGEYVAPTCTETGSQEYISEYGTAIEIIPAINHNWGAWDITTEPTKTTVGEAQRVCSNDNSHIDTKELPILADTTVWVAGEYIAPTCTETGSQTYTSEYGTVVENIPATEHSWGAWSITKEPTKTETGIAERICNNNSNHKDSKEIAILTDDTVWTKGEYVAPTCTETGSQTYTSEYGTVVETIPVINHSWGAWSITTEPTKTTVGEAQRICANDNNHIDTKELPVLTDEAIWTKGEYIAPTCEANGSQTYTSEYGTVIEIIPAINHSWGAWDITTEPTQTEKGTAERICNNDNNHIDAKELPVLTDTTVWVAGEYIAPTCTETGSQIYTSEYGTVVETIPAINHSWGAWNITTEPTKTETGMAERICNNDNNHKDNKEIAILTDETIWTKGEYIAPTCTEAGSQTYTSEYGTVVETIPAINHSWGVWSITTEPTKATVGEAQRICANDSNHIDTDELPMLTDTSVWTAGAYVAPTCTEAGSQTYTSEYGTVVETIPAINHSWGAWSITTEPTKTTVGEAQRVCSNDNSHIDTKELPMLTDEVVWTKGEYVAPTCTETGSQTYTSEYGTVVETIPAINHSWGAWSITTEPTKTTVGEAQRICANDNNHIDTKELPVLTDEAIWTKGEYIAPTCEANGSQTYTSEYGTVVETIPAINHNWGAWNITTEPTKTTVGEAQRICANDNNHIDTKELPVLTDEAIWTKGEYIAPTCEANGSQTYTSEYGTVVETIPAINHSWGAWNITTKPTKTTVGEAQRICANDSNHVDIKELPMLTDTTVWTAGAYVAPTCTEAGSQTYTSEYGTVVETIPAINHSWGAWSITTEPTKTTVGEAQRICTNDSNHIDTDELPMLTDTSVWTAGTYVAPTCEANGSQTYTSEYGTVVETISAINHNWGAWNFTTEPTKTTVGEAQRVCANDNNHIDTKELPVLTDETVWTKGEYVAPTCTETGSQTYTSEYGTVVETIPAINHSWGAWSITTEPTKTTVGEAQRVCSNDSNHVDTKELPMLTDTTVWVAGEYIAPTCTETGSQTYTSEYGTVIEIIPATDHSWGAWSITTEPTKTAAGEAQRVCANDSNHIDTDELPMLTDTTVWTAGAYVAPTCTEAGSQTYTSEYGTVVETIPAINHSWGAWSITTEPTKTTVGEAQRICTNDSNHIDTDELPMLTDTTVWTAGAYVAPTCTETGSQTYTSEYGTVIETIPAINHSWGAWSITTEPTKTTVGEAQRICANDNNHIDAKELPVLTDTTVWTAGAYVAPTCTETGSQTYTSEYGTVIEIIPAINHNWGAWNITTEPTKTTVGEAQRICTNDSNHIDTKELPILTDTTVWTAGAYVAPTCTETGSQTYTSEYGTVVETISAINHNWGVWSITTEPTKTTVGEAQRICANDSNHIDTDELPMLTDTTVWTAGAYVAPTCTETGSQTYTSEYGTVVETIPATDHSWGAWNITTEPTKATVGEAQRICANDNNHIDTKELPVLTDTTVWTAGAYVAPTCTETGSQTYTSEYGTVVETISAINHNWGAWNITTEPTKTTVGEAQRSCANDSNHIDTDELPMLTDTSVWTAGTYVAPTCEANGSQNYTSEYGTVIEIIPATDHSWGAWNITTEPTKTTVGEAQRICANDSNHVDTKELPMLTDTTVWTAGAYVAPVCEVNGSQSYTSEYGTVVEIIPALEHDYEWITTKEPTEEETGLKHEECSRCHATKNETEIEKLPKTKFTITFDLNGGNNVSSETLLTSSEGKLSELPTATRTGNYRFEGWFTAQTGGDKISVETVFTTDTTVYAQWTYTGGSSVTRYTVTFNSMGGSKVDSIRVRRNTAIQKPADPVKDGFTFGGWFTDEEFNTEYDFATKVTRSITLYAKWNDVNSSANIDEWDNPFDDVHKEDWFYNNVKYVYTNGLMVGTAENLFSPNLQTTRGMIITILYRLENEPKEGQNIFPDVDENSYYADAVAWGVNNGIVKGYDDGLYRPEQNISRQELAAILHRHAKWSGKDYNATGDLSKFVDKEDIGEWAMSDISWAVAKELIYGKGNNILDPEAFATRAEVAAMIMRYIENVN